MDKGVRNNLANDDFAQTFTDIPLQKERIGKMLARKFHEAVVGRYQIDADDITLEAELSGDLGINSIELADLVMLCEDKFDIEIEDTDINKFVTIGDVVNYLETL